MSLPSTARRLWSLFEPLHAVTYFTPQSAAAFEAAGLTGFWRRYFAGRAAALGAIGPGPVTAAFFGFAPAMVSRALPDDQWQAAARRLEQRGWLTAEGVATAAGRDAYAEVEALTNRLAATPWRQLGDTGTERCASLLAPLTARAWKALPDDNPIPLRPGH